MTFQDAVLFKCNVQDAPLPSSMQAFLDAQDAAQAMTNAQDAVLFSIPSIIATVSMALLTMWIYPRVAWRLQRSGKESAKLCQRILPSTLFQITVVLGLYQAWSCWSYTFRHMPSHLTTGDVPWCLCMSGIFLGVIGLHA